MYETGNQKDCHRKRIILRDPRCQRGGDEACKSAESAECTGCCYRIRSTVPCHCAGCRTRGINLNIVVKYTQRPAGRCYFCRRFVCFNTVFLHNTNDSLVYQSAKAPDICSIFEFQSVLECFVDSLADLIISMRINGRKQSHRIHTFPQIIKKALAI